MSIDQHGAEQVGPTGPSGIPDTPPDRVGPPPGVTVAGSPVPHRPWSTVLLVFHALGLAAGVVAVGCGVALIAEAFRNPPSDSRPGYEPWGFAFGVAFAVIGAVLIVATVVLTVVTVKARRAADQGRTGVLQGLAITVVTLAVIGALNSLAGGVRWFLVGLVLCGIYALPGVFILRAMRATYRA